MQSFLNELRQTLVPDLNSQHGPLPPLLIALTFVTGLVDAFSYLALGRVFVANMTGNVVFLGFGLAAAADFSIQDSLVALLAFGLGASMGGGLGSRLGQHRARHLSTAASIEAAFLAVCVVLMILSGTPIAGGFHYALIAVLGMSMGVQNATVRILGVPDLTTTVLTLTITGIAADSTLVGGKGSLAGRRLLAVGAMLAGALVGAAMILHLNAVYPLVIALVLVSLVGIASRVLGTSDAAWVHQKR